MDFVVFGRGNNKRVDGLEEYMEGRRLYEPEDLRLGCSAKGCMNPKLVSSRPDRVQAAALRSGELRRRSSVVSQDWPCSS
jgi:hypothetical protein